MAEVRVPKVKVRCPQCGAKNDDVAMCRICGMSLPNAAEIRSRAGEGGPAFKETVESERLAWREYSEGRTNTGMRSRRPAQLPKLAPEGSADADANAESGGEIGSVEGRRRGRWRRR